ncbi:glycosyltransferase family 39 protein [Paenibacillus filicis]|uniref:Glycosyltransferase family 39 protein n=1 Tax=Paenibacillus gyeongsangnamensis TaxID=3388067 RepID=A0ABT4Q8T4_9BACL|nr:glycosyltransferase family 39 protein [Paenibacillus filicis]MCZ8513293.1 glycosyltransferase family 39 protein [Paenibacillus filicis]
MKTKLEWKTHGHYAALALILLLSAVLNLYNISMAGYGNTYYASAVKSMLQSWHNFFYASYDPGGFITVDKPPVALWVQTLSASLFGYKGWALIMPQALASVVSAALLYNITAKIFGRTAGLLSALLLAVTPVLVAVSRTNNMDSILVMVLMLATWFIFKGAEQGRLRWLIVSAVLVGVGFNIKMLQAFMVLPAFYLLYWLAPKLTYRKKLMHLAVTTVILAIVSLSWAVIVDSVPQDQRPYIGSSTKNSVLQLMIGYNGIQRFEGMNRQGGGMASDRTDDGSRNRSDRTQMQGTGTSGDAGGSLPQSVQGTGSAGDTGGQLQPPAGMTGQGGTAPGMGGPAGGGPGGFGGGGPGGVGETGTKGPLRLFNANLSGQISWLLPLAIAGAAALLWGARFRPLGALTGRQRTALFWVVWLAPMMFFFSYAGFFHRYYLIMLAPGIAALSGAGLVKMWHDFRSGESKVKAALLPIGFAATAAFDISIAWRYAELQNSLALTIALLAFLSLASLVLLRKRQGTRGKLFGPAAITAGLAALLLAPGFWSLTPALYGGNNTIPYAGPDLNNIRGGGKVAGRGPGMGGPGGGGPESTVNQELVAYLVSHYNKDVQGAYLVVTNSSMSASPLIMETGLPVMATGGFSGTDPAITADQLAKLAKEGKVKYFLVSSMGPGGGGGTGSQQSVNEWILQHAKEVPSEEWRGAQVTAASVSADGSASGDPMRRMDRMTKLYVYQGE